MDILLISSRAEELAAFAAELAAGGASVSVVPSGAAALSAVASAVPTLCVVDEELPDMKSFALVARLMQANALMHTAVVSGLSDEEFHEAGEGLGILRRLPGAPGASEARELLAALAAVS